MQNFNQEGTQVRYAFKKNGQQTNNYCKFFKGVHISNIHKPIGKFVYWL